MKYARIRSEAAVRAPLVRVAVAVESPGCVLVLYPTSSAMEVPPRVSASGSCTRLPVTRTGPS